MIPAFVLFRDRVTYGRQVVNRLRDTGVFDVHVVDFGTTWPAALDWLATENVWGSMRRGSPFEHPYELWRSGLLRWLLAGGGYAGAQYLVTDCDVLPPAGPPWWIAMADALERHTDIVKAGACLSLELPPTIRHRDEILSWERQYWRIRRPCGCYTADVDTTLALYRPLPAQEPDSVDNYPGVGPAVRVSPDTAGMARHLPWHETTPDAGELVYYAEHINEGVTHWTAKR